MYQDLVATIIRHTICPCDDLRTSISITLTSLTKATTGLLYSCQPHPYYIYNICRRTSTNTLNRYRSRIRCRRINIITNRNCLCHQDLVATIIGHTICPCDDFRTCIAIRYITYKCNNRINWQLSASSVIHNIIPEAHHQYTEQSPEQDSMPSDQYYHQL